MDYINIALIMLAFFASTEAVTLGVANGSIESPHISPWQVKLYLVADISNSWPCGGTLISRNYVLTAARCFTYKHILTAQIVDIYLGAWDVQNPEPSLVTMNTRTLGNVIIHGEYNAITHGNDIALIKLPILVNYTDYIQPAKLATTRNVKIGDVIHISGWQYPIREWDPAHQYPHGGNVTVVENSLCKANYPEYDIDDDTICASGNVAFCYGDEGIALPSDGEVVGLAYGAKDVLTPSEECPIVPQTYLPIAKYLDWIKAHSDYLDN